MPRCRTDCLQKPLARAFSLLGALVARQPWWFLLLPMVVSAGLGAGFYFLPRRLSNDIEEQFTPIGGPAKRERAFIREHFPTNDSGQFAAQRLYTEGTYASLIAVSTGDDNILTPGAFEELLLLDQRVRALQASAEKRTFQELCARSAGSCVPANPLLQAVNGSAAAIESLNVTYPMFMGRHFLGTALGGVQLPPAPYVRVQRARALRMVYYLKEDSAEDRETSREWLQKFLSAIPAQQKAPDYKSIQVKMEQVLS